MANKKPLKTASPQEKAMTLVKKPETIIGAVVLTGLLVIGVSALKKSGAELDSAAATDTVAQELTPPATPVAVEASPSAKPLAAIEKLANTASTKVVVAKEGDTFWDIAETICGNGAVAEKIERSNGYTYQHLQPGDRIEVSCK